ncbi:uncharacterized protein IUM83_06135 [Phytophthora cinnamomi]|uniref:uncharacterized protein n=1 Tax=Phytophthora cinnamomi TaxID=4785 RepID=UPI00355A012D|nr:hypothetical protein IUM83_06135 [Phytophthora cinnamomi]
MASWKPVSSKTLKLDMQTCSANVGDVIEKELGDIFGVMWDGWTHGTVHYVGIYGVTFVNGKRRERLLSLSPLVDGSQDAEVHIAMFKRVLSLYNKNVSMVAFLVGDNCATNRRIATLMELPLVGGGRLSGYGKPLAPKRKIVHSPVFEAALVKIENKVKLTAAEARSVQRFVVDPPASSGKRKERSSSDYANEILRGGKKARSSGAASATYHDLAKVVPPTSNTVERLFSQCKFILTPQRSCMLPANFEMLAFLRVNRDLWNATSLLTTE